MVTGLPAAMSPILPVSTDDGKRVASISFSTRQFHISPTYSSVSEGQAISWTRPTDPAVSLYSVTENVALKIELIDSTGSVYGQRM
jgi:hypothetical protein